MQRLGTGLAPPKWGGGQIGGANLSRVASSSDIVSWKEASCSSFCCRALWSRSSSGGVALPMPLAPPYLSLSRPEGAACCWEVCASSPSLCSTHL